MSGTIACVHAPDLALQAMLRGLADAQERTGASGLVSGPGGRAVLLAVSADAAAAGLRAGMTVAQARAVLPSLRVLTVRAADVEAATAALTDLGLAFAPRVESEAERVFFQVGDLGALYPDLDSVARAVRARAARLGLQVRIGMAAGKGLARVASRVVVDHGNPERVPKPSRDGLRWAEPTCAQAIDHGNPERVPKPSRDGLRRAEPTCAQAGVDHGNPERVPKPSRDGLRWAEPTCAQAGVDHGNPERVPKPSRDGLRWAEPTCAQAIDHGNPERVPKPSRDGLRRAEPTCAHAIDADDRVIIPSPAAAARAFLAPLPLSVLDPGTDVATSLHRWGLRTVGDLARLPSSEVTVRLGAAGARLARLAAGVDEEPFLPQPPADAIEEGTELDYGIDSLEPLAFVLRGLIERALARLQCRGLACAGMVLRLQVEPRGFDVRDVPLQSPTREAGILLQLVRLDLARHPPGAPVTGLTIMVHPARVRAMQLDMLRPNGPAPDRLAATLARLHALVGPEHVGTPRAPDVWREERLQVEPLQPDGICGDRDDGDGPRDSDPGVGMRRFRPPQDVEVLMGRDGPTAFRGAHTAARILIAAGPYRVSGAWWAASGVHRDYWDVHASDGAVYRMHQERENGRWFLDGYYD